MEHRKLLRRFRLRLLGHCLLRASLWGIAMGGAATFVCSLVWHLLLREPAAIWLLGSLGIGFILGFLPSFIKHFPTRKRTAKRLDRAGLQERAGTMLAFEKKNGLLVELQRKDAMVHIENTETKRLTMDFPFRAMIATILCAALAGTMVLLPYDLFAPNEPNVSTEDQQISALIDDLRQQVRDAQLDAATMAELEALLDQLEQDLMATDNELERAALIHQAQQDIEETLMYSTISRYAIGRAMMGYTLTEGLGKQISGDQPTFLSEPMDQLLKDITGPTKQISRLSNNLTNALADSGIDPYDMLYSAIDSFAIGLKDMLSYTEGPDGEAVWTYEDLAFLFEIAEENMLAALEEQAHTEGEMENLSTSMSMSLESLLENGGGELMKNEGQQGGANNQNNASNPSGGSEGNPTGTPSGGLFDSGESNSGASTMLEGIYDPVSGNVAYGEVFAAYYAQYLEALDEGKIPEELRPYFERYFSSLS